MALPADVELENAMPSRRPCSAVGVSRVKLLIPERRRRVVCVLKDRFLVTQPRACLWRVITATLSAGPTGDGD